MTEPLYRLAYCSRNQIRGTSDGIRQEIEKILLASRRNNPPAGITGALLFNEGLFAQVLEGPLPAIERTFERIQQDPRHSDVTVLQSGPCENREFGDWSMAFAATGSDSQTAAEGPSSPIENALSGPSVAAEKVIDMLRELVVQEDWMMA
jgi:hypothetical protein